MMNTFDEEYVHRVREETQRYTRELLEENQRLRSYAAIARSELATAQAEMQRYATERAALDRHLQSIEAEGRRYLQQYINVEQQNANLANLYVASFRLHSSFERAEVIEAIKEIIINLIGSEEFAVFEFDEARSHLRLAGSFGIDEAPYRRMPAGRGIIGECVRTGEVFVAPQPATATDGADSLTACIPLRAGGEVIGVVAIFRLLSQKSGVEQLDRELFNVLATHAAAALYCATLHGERSMFAVGAE